jgi:hypothetical protein
MTMTSAPVAPAAWTCAFNSWASISGVWVTTTTSAFLAILARSSWVRRLIRRGGFAVTVPSRQSVPGLRVLEPDEIENLLCIYKDALRAAAQGTLFGLGDDSRCYLPEEDG